MNAFETVRLAAALLSFAVPAAAFAAPPRVPEAEARRAVERLRAEALSLPPSPDLRGNLVRRIEGLGPDAAPALLDVLRLDGNLARTADPARRLFAAAAAEAVGRARLPEAAPVFRAILDGDGDEPRIAHSAAAGLGRLCGDEEVRYLAALAIPDGRREGVAVAGLGYCRRGPAAEALLTRLAATPDADVARALGTLGSSWAWEALGPARRAEGEALRGTIARGLVKAFAKADPDTRKELARALLVVSATETPALLAAEKARSPESAPVIDELLRRVERRRADEPIAR